MAVSDVTGVCGEHKFQLHVYKNFDSTIYNMYKNIYFYILLHINFSC